MYKIVRNMKCLIIAGLMIVPFKLDADTELIISAAASLSTVMEIIRDEFKQQHPDVRILMNYASSGTLLQQIRYGAPADIYVSANRTFMNQAVEEKLVIKSTKKTFAGNSLVLASSLTFDIRSGFPAVLKQDSFKYIAMGSPESVPAGRYALQALQSMDLFKKIETNVVYGNSVVQVLDYLVRDEVDLGIIYSTDLIRAENKVKKVCTLSGHQPVLYPAAVVTESENVSESRLFISFLVSEKGQTILTEFGFTIPENK